MHQLVDIFKLICAYPNPVFYTRVESETPRWICSVEAIGRRNSYMMPEPYEAAFRALTRNQGVTFSHHMRMVDEEHLRQVSDALNQLSDNRDQLDSLIRWLGLPSRTFFQGSIGSIFGSWHESVARASRSAWKIGEEYLLELYNGRDQLYHNWEGYDGLVRCFIFLYDQEDPWKGRDLLGRRIHVRSGMFMDDKLVSSYFPGLRLRRHFSMCKLLGFPQRPVELQPGQAL